MIPSPSPYAHTILIVDDMPVNVGIVAKHLEDQDMQVLVAQDGAEALERAQLAQPDLILLDVRMPGIDGFETCRRLKMDVRTKDIPVIFMTALAGTADMVEGFSAGGVDYVTKPFQIAEVLARISTHLTLRAMHKQLAAQNVQLQREVAVRLQAEAALHRAHDDLEERVARRTAELARVNASLKSEIAERKRAEAELQASEARFRAIVETSPVPLCITSMPEGKILYANQPFLGLFGLAAQQVAGTSIVQFYGNPKDRETVVQRLRQEGSLRNLELWMKRLDGTRFWVWASARLATFGSAPAIYAGFYDVTARKQAEEKLRASEASLANAQRLARLGDWEWDVGTGTAHWSDEVYRILGVNPGALQPSYETFVAAVHPDDRESVEQAVRELLQEKKPYDIDHRIVLPDGVVRIVQFQAELKDSGAGRSLAMVGTIQDITERKGIEQELLASREQLRQLSAYLEAVREEERKHIAMEVHDELGQLLTALKMDVSLLRMRLEGDSEAVKKIGEMRELVEKTIWMVRNVASHLRPAALNFGIVSALEWLAEDFSRHNGIPCKLDLRCGEVSLGDALATAVFRIVQESLTNVARHAAASLVQVTLARSDESLDLRVTDDGRGFDPVAARKGYSYGLLGMAERARLIGASLHIDSTPGTGTVVSIHLPLDSDPQP